MRTMLIFLVPVLAFGAVDHPAWTAPELTRVFDKPDPAHAFAAAKIYSPDGSVWRKPVEDWEGARRRVAGDPAWAQWLAQEKAQTDAWMARSHDHAEWVAGWGHEFVSPKDGSFLTFTPDVPGVDVKFLRSPSDPHVEITPKIFRAWVVDFRASNMAMVERAARLWRLTGDPKDADWAAAQLDFYARNRLKWPIQDRFYGPSQLFGQPLDEAVCLIKLTDAARLIWERTSPGRRQYWIDNFFEPEARLMNQSTRENPNIGCWLRSASGQIALFCGDQPLWRWVLDGPWGVRQQMTRGVTSDYLWFEQSMGYNEYMVQALTSFFLAAAQHGHGPEVAREMEIFENLALAPDLLRFPNGGLPNFADGTYQRHVPFTNLLLGFYRVLPTARGVAAARETHNWDTLIDPPQGPPVPISPLPPVTTRNFESTRFAILRAGGWQVFFHYGQLTGSHAQAGALDFEAYYGDTDVSHVPWTVGYGSPLHHGYYTRGLNHNVPLINGEGEIPAHPGVLRVFDAARASVEADQPDYRTDASAGRALRIDGSRLVDRASIAAKAGVPQLLGLALHLQGRVILPAAFAPVADFATGRPLPFSYWREVKVATCRDQASFEVRYASGLVLRVAVSTPGEFRVFHAEVPDAPPPARSEAFYVEKFGASAIFTTEFTPVP